MTSLGEMQSQNFIYMSPLMKQRLDLKSTPIEIPIPLNYFEWATFMECKAFFADNFVPFVMFLAGGMQAFHYKKLLEVTVSKLHIYIYTLSNICDVHMLTSVHIF